jgi:hypothetical protein
MPNIDQLKGDVGRSGQLACGFVMLGFGGAKFAIISHL